MTFRPLNPLPTPDEVLDVLDPKPGETYGYITREDIRFGWLYFLSLAWGNVASSPPPSATSVVPEFDLNDEYQSGAIVRFNSAIWISTMTIAPLGLTPGQTVQWQRVDSRPTVTMALVVGQAPATYDFPQTPVQGDFFINVADRVTWIRGPAGWQQILVQESARPYAEAIPTTLGSVNTGWTKWPLTAPGTDSSGTIVVNPNGMLLNRTGIYTVNFVQMINADATVQIRVNDSIIVSSQTVSAAAGQATLSATRVFTSGVELSPYVNFAANGGSGGGSWSKFAVTYLGPRFTTEPVSPDIIAGTPIPPAGIDGGPP